MLDNLGDIKSNEDGNSIQSQNEAVPQDSKNGSIQELENEFYSTMTEYTTNYQLLTKETIENTQLQTSTKPYYGKTITVDNKGFSYINPFGYKHTYETDNAWSTRNAKCIGEKPPCPSACNTCNSGFVKNMPEDKITIQSNNGSSITVLNDLTIQFGGTSNGNCPAVCSKSQPGGATDGGAQLNTKNICTNYSSLLGFCGNGAGYTTGTDCRGCATPPVIYRIPVDVAAGTFKMRTDENNYISIDNNGKMSISPTFQTATPTLTFIFKLVPLGGTDQYALQVHINGVDKYISVQKDGTIQLDDVRHDWNNFTIKGLTNIPPAGGLPLINGKCNESCSVKGFCGKGSAYMLGGVDCTNCDKLDDNVITVSQDQYNTIGRQAKAMNDGQPCGIAGKFIKNNTTKEVSWVDTESVKHPFLKGAWDKKHKTCKANNILNLSADEYANIPSGDPMTSATMCKRSYSSNDLEATLDTQYKKLQSLANQIISETKTVDETNNSQQQQLSQTRDRFGSLMNTVSTDHNNWKTKQQTGVSVSAQKDSSGLFANSNELHMYLWCIVAIAIILYGLFIGTQERYGIYDANKLTTFNTQNVVMLLAIVWLIYAGWNHRPNWMRRDWYTLPAWLR